MTTENPIMSSLLFDRAGRLVEIFNRSLAYLAPAGDVLLRLWVANVFFKSGLTKIQSFDSTIALFEYEYSVPLLSPVVAAYLGTATELIFPALLLLGLAGRFSAFVLFFFNIIAAVSYPEISDLGVRDHQVWGIMLFVSMVHGPGKLSLDYLIWHRLRHLWRREA